MITQKAIFIWEFYLLDTKAGDGGGGGTRSQDGCPSVRKIYHTYICAEFIPRTSVDDGGEQSGGLSSVDNSLSSKASDTISS